ncbi:hypothetical protein C5C11_03750 [Rathayibacter rathayi]|nr:hypothetical protein C5C11_03750 [Rathayibacter rathayi]
MENPVVYVALDAPLGGHNRANLLTRTFGILGCGQFVSLLVRAIVADRQRQGSNGRRRRDRDAPCRPECAFLRADWPVTDLG